MFSKMSKEISILENALRREKEARKLSERILEEKSLELYHAKKQLEALYQERTKELNISKENELKSQEEKKIVDFRLFSLIENISDIFFTVNETGHFTFINKKAMELSGYSMEDFKGEHFTKFIPKEYHHEMIANYLNQILENKETTYVEFPFIDSTGNIIWLGQKVSLVKNGDHLEFVAIARNISEQKDAQDALKKSEEKYRSIIENMDLGILEMDNNYRIIDAYPKFCEMTGYERNDLIGKDAKTFIYRSTNKSKNIESNEENGYRKAYESRLERKDKELLWAIVSEAPMNDGNGDLIGRIAVHLDITNRKNFERELKRAKKTAEDAAVQRELFVANVSHELRTPLNAILGMIDQLDPNQSANEFDEKIEVVEVASKQLLHLIDDILSFSKIDSNVMIMESQRNSLNSIAQNIITELNPVAKKKGLILSLNADIEDSREHFIDKMRLFQVLNNLISNAIKYTEKGKVEVELKILKQSEDEDLIAFKVKDSGIGINSEDISIIFEPFVQLNNRISLNEDGAGLGLAITKKIIDLMGGELNVRSEKGIGSEFSFELRLRTGDSISNHDEIKNYELEIQEDFKKVKILVAEDNLLNQKVIKGLLDSWNIEVEIASDGNEVMNLIRSEINYDLILLDLKMPVMNGFEIVRIIKEKSPDLPVIALTASSIDQVEKHSESVFFDFILSKPINKERLNKALIKFLRNS